jgi:excisionase family DNA binding protein
LVEVTTLKRHPMVGIAKTQGERYNLMAAQLLRQQAETAQLFCERLLTVREAAQALGGVGVGTVRRYVRTGVLRSVRVGKLGWIRIPAGAVRELLGNGGADAR